jgi:hypothetical protein
MKTGLEEIKVTQSEATQKKIEAIAEHYEGAPRTLLPPCRSCLPMLYEERLKDRHSRSDDGRAAWNAASAYETEA